MRSDTDFDAADGVRRSCNVQDNPANPRRVVNAGGCPLSILPWMRRPASSSDKNKGCFRRGRKEVRLGFYPGWRHYTGRGGTEARLDRHGGEGRQVFSGPLGFVGLGGRRSLESPLVSSYFAR